MSMKAFKNYLQDNSLEETLLNHIKNHLIVEMYSYDFMPFFEALGNFNNCGRVAEYVLSQILKTTENTLTIDCRKFKVFFDSIVLNIKTDLSYHMEYDSLENRVLTINIYLKKEISVSDHDTILSLLLHEMMHGYEDKRRTKHGKPSIYDILDDSYGVSLQLARSYIQIKHAIGLFNYFMNDQEKNAYFGTLENTIENIIKRNNYTLDNYNYDNILDEIKNDKSGCWSMYFDLCKFILKLNNDELTENETNELVSTYNYSYKENMDFNQIKKKVNSKWDKFYKKFNQLVQKIICKVLSEQPHKRKFVDFEPLYDTNI